MPDFYLILGLALLVLGLLVLVWMFGGEKPRLG